MSDNTIQEIKNRLNIAEIIGEYLKLEKAGANFKARCPFHNEKTPSFFISPDRGTYYCFGCGAKGDLISFVQNFEGLDFMGALKMLADRAGVPLVLKKHSKNEFDDKKSLYDILEKARDFFIINLKQNTEAINYLKNRGLSDETILFWKIGFAKDEWQNLHDHLRVAGFTDDLMLKTGLVKKNEAGRIYDTFRGRIIFPLNDSSGRVVGFSGRIFPNKEDEAKYLNSPETEVFKKSKLLYGYDQAKLGIRKYGFAILVEGQLDLLLSHQANWTNTIATSGTALTEDHLTIIKRLTNNLIVAYDNDKAGVMATEKTYKMALRAGFNLKAVVLPDGMDPADLIKDNKADWANSIKNAVNIPELILNFLKNEKNNEKLIRQMRIRLWPILASIDSQSERHRIVSELKLSVITGIREDFLMEEILKTREREINNSLENTNLEKPDLSKNNYQEILWGTIFMLEDKQSVPSVGNFFTDFKEILAEDFEIQKTKFLAFKEELIFKAEQIMGENDLDKFLLDVGNFLKIKIFNQRLQVLTRQLEETKNNDEKHNDILIKCQEISKKIQDLKNLM